MITIYGASDDLIEVDGDISEEFQGGDADGELLAFSDGTVLRVTYTSAGVWRIAQVAYGSAECRFESVREGDADNYSDRAALKGNITWVLVGSQIAHRKKENA